jgi:prepilin-type N-terminal cleavage/methylation domain-containing protein
MKKLSKKGFTLIELMIVVAIIGILAAIAIPKFADLIEKSKEGATKGNIGSLKSAISIYYGNESGIWPAVLANNTSVTIGDDSTLAFSSYMDPIPFVEVTAKFDPSPISPYGSDVNPEAGGVGVPPSTNATGWLYDSSTGDIWVDSIELDSMGIPYSDYGVGGS